MENDAARLAQVSLMTMLLLLLMILLMNISAAWHQPLSDSVSPVPPCNNIIANTTT